ncbi:hypothetical protein GCM10028803_54300 [Larkinella knui]|uniref:Uncharacterized protein n=1 Tax=Larkinella knui TaxID=2025310 RepID=A0A3P1CHK7_9BACT|nr:hypothetical protein [Larkinella knui]RRB12364.1 hypothetical protein EHT87_19390 [Larkinella knui]
MESNQTKFPFDFQELLASQLALEPFESTEPTPFLLFRVANTPIILHCVTFETYTVFQQRTDVRLFFQHLSDWFSAKNWQLIHLWEDVWRQQPTLVLSRLRAMAGLSERIPARLTQVRRIDKPTAGRFLQDNHLQVVTHSKYKYGLFLPQRYFRILSADFSVKPPDAAELLVAVATFSYPRRVVRDGISHRSVELVRFANKLNCTVVGGLDKLLKAFVTDVRPDDIMTYADRDWSTGRSYEKLGFTRLEQTKPQHFWVRPGEWIRHYPTFLPAGFTENEMPANGYSPVYNAGSIKFLKIL